MSAAAPQQLHDGDSKSSVLPFASPSSQSQALDSYLEQVAALDITAIRELQAKPIPELVKLWKRADQIQTKLWVARCGISVNVWDQTASAKRGRGNKDVGERGILAAVSRTSKQLDVTPSTIYLNARIFRLIMEVHETNAYSENNILEVLDQQGYWEHALTAANPVKAIVEFAHQKTSQKRFRTTDAQRLVLTEGMSRKAVALKAVETARKETGNLSERELMVAHIKFAKAIISEQIIPNCPNEEFKERIWEELLTELEEEHQELFDQDACDALRKAWEGGGHREDQLVEATSFPLADVSRLMGVMSNLSEFIRIQPRDIRQRSHFQLWHKTGEPFDNAKYVPMVKKG